MSQLDEAAARPNEENDEAMPDTRITATINRDAVARRRRIEEVVERKRAHKYAGDYDFNLDE